MPTPLSSEPATKSDRCRLVRGLKRLADSGLVLRFVLGAVLSPCVVELTTEEFGHQSHSAACSRASPPYDSSRRSPFVSVRSLSLQLEHALGKPLNQLVRHTLFSQFGNAFRMSRDNVLRHGEKMFRK